MLPAADKNHFHYMAALCKLPSLPNWKGFSAIFQRPLDLQYKKQFLYLKYIFFFVFQNWIPPAKQGSVFSILVGTERLMAKDPPKSKVFIQICLKSSYQIWATASGKESKSQWPLRSLYNSSINATLSLLLEGHLKLEIQDRRYWFLVFNIEFFIA